MTANKKYQFPWLTLILSVITITMFSLFTWYTRDNEATPLLYTQLGAPTALEIYDGQFWGVIMNSFLHNRIDILLANLAGLWILAAYLEKRIKFQGLFPLGLFASATTSLVQLTLTDNPGIGVTAVNYFFFFFILVKSFKDENYHLKGRFVILPLMLIFLFWCWYMDDNYGWYMAVDSMVAGVILGSTVGALSLIRFKPLYIGITTVLFFGFFSLIYYSPWSADWNVSHAIRLHKKGKIEEAKVYYEKALQINSKNINARQNMFKIRIDELCDTAFYWHSKEDYIKARFYYEQILKLDPSNEWAKEQLKKLP